MAELPSPRSVAVATLLTLHADPNSDLHRLDHLYGDSGVDVGRPDAVDGRPASAAEWSDRLLVLVAELSDEDAGGDVVLPRGTDLSASSALGGRHADDWAWGGEDPAGEETRADDIIIGGDVLDLRPVVEPGPADAGRPPPGPRLGLAARPLGELLGRLDAAFFGTARDGHRRDDDKRGAGGRRDGGRSPPSLALLSRLRLATSSVDSLVDLLDNLGELGVVHPDASMAAVGVLTT